MQHPERVRGGLGRRAARGVGVVAALGAAGWGGWGCSSYQPPRFTLEEIRRAETGPDGTVLEFTILAENRNDRPLPLREAEYALLIDGERVFSGVRSPEATVRRFGAQRFTLPAVVPPEAIPERGSFTAALSGSVEYLTPGALAEVLFDTGVRRPNAPLHVSGVVRPGAGEAEDVLFEAPEADVPAVEPVREADPGALPEEAAPGADSGSGAPR